jgi:hypothetical protein
VVVSKSGATGGLALACLLFAVALSGAAIGLPYYGPGVFGGPFALMTGALLLGACAGLFAVLATVFGASAFRSAPGRVAAVGGAVLLLGVAAYLLWAFALG